MGFLDCLIGAGDSGSSNSSSSTGPYSLAANGTAVAGRTGEIGEKCRFFCDFFDLVVCYIYSAKARCAF